MSKIKNGGLDQYGAEPFEQQQFGTAGAEWVNDAATFGHLYNSSQCYNTELIPGDVSSTRSTKLKQITTN